jgi:uncharacterized protein (DUF433 family)
MQILNWHQMKVYPIAKNSRKSLMARIEIGKYLAVDSRVCGGRLIFKGTRIPVADAWDMIEMGYTPEGISKQYRGLVAPEAVREAKSLILRGFLKEETAKHKVAA